MTDDQDPDDDQLTVRLAQAGVSDPDVYRQAQDLELQQRLAQVEAEKRELENQTTLETVLSNVDVNELFGLVSDLVRLGAEVSSDRPAPGVSARQPQTETQDKTDGRSQSRAEQLVKQNGNRDSDTGN